MIWKKILAIIFSVTIILFPILTAVLPKSDFSEAENRELAEFPNISFSEIYDKSFMNGFDSYISDHFFGRDFWVKLKSISELFTLKKENNNILLTDKKTLVEDLKAPDKRKVSLNADGIKGFCEKYPDKNIYLAIAPTACDIYSNELPYNKITWSQKKFIDDFTSQIGKCAYNIDIYSTLSQKKDQYIYYNSDHHWTMLGAYYAYSQIASSLGFKPYAKNQFDIEHASYDFYGTLSSKSNISVAPDTVDLYTLASSEFKIKNVEVNNGNKITNRDDIYFREFLTQKDKYSVYSGQVQPEITIKTNVKNSKKLLIFKDSFAHSLVPFLSLHYSEIKMIDLRYIGGNFENHFNTTEYDDILFLYNVDSIAHEADISKLSD